MTTWAFYHKPAEDLLEIQGRVQCRLQTQCKSHRIKITTKTEFPIQQGSYFFMSAKKEYLSPCGMYCSVCAVRAADRDNDRGLKEMLAPIFGLKPEQIACEGCRSEKPFPFVMACAIRACADEKRLEGCHQCGDFPCDHIKTFPFEISRHQMMAAVPRRKELGTDQWVMETEKHFSCRHCGSLLHRYAKACHRCQKPTDTLK